MLFRSADPLSFDEVAAKFARLAAPVKEPRAIARISEAAAALPVAPQLDAFSRALREGNLPAGAVAAAA